MTWTLSGSPPTALETCEIHIFLTLPGMAKKTKRLLLRLTLQGLLRLLFLSLPKATIISLVGIKTNLAGRKYYSYSRRTRANTPTIPSVHTHVKKKSLAYPNSEP